MDKSPVVKHLDVGRIFSLGVVACEQLDMFEVFSFETKIEPFF